MSHRTDRTIEELRGRFVLKYKDTFIMYVSDKMILIFPYKVMYNIGKHSNSPVERLKNMKPSQ